MTATIDLNADLGEEVGDDEGDAGDRDQRKRRLWFPRRVSDGPRPHVRAGSPSRGRNRGPGLYPDREGFGRRYMAMDPEDLRADIVYQIGALAALASAAGTRVRYVKPHGALYNTIVADEEQAAAVVEAVRSVDPGLPVMGLPGSLVLAMARDAGLPVITEAFADRGYRPDGTLVPRSEPGALLTDSDEIARRVVELVTTGRLTAVDGSTIVIEAESVCLHGDTPGAVEHARTTRAALLSAGVSLAPITRH